jgi:hypothetical protein
MDCKFVTSTIFTDIFALFYFLHRMIKNNPVIILASYIVLKIKKYTKLWETERCKMMYFDNTPFSGLL